LTPFHAVVLSLVQAVTEFLPISSSGHLILVPYLLGWPDQGLSFDIATNTGTLIAVLLYFRDDLRELIAGFFTGRRGSEDFEPRRLGWAVVLATVPVGIAGLLFHEAIGAHLRKPLLIATTAIVFGLVLGFADHVGRRDRELVGLGWRDALVIGAAQALALVPGTSRSGITITAALLLGFSRSTAARFSFLLAVPVGILAALLDLRHLLRGEVAADQLVAMLIAIVVSAAAGYVVIGWLLSWIRSRTLSVFVVYRLLLGALIFAVVAMRG
jgi:undecaprenyl-diphosphatase